MTAKKQKEILPIAEAKMHPFPWVVQLFTDRHEHQAFVNKNRPGYHMHTDKEQGRCAHIEEKSWAVIGVYNGELSVLAHELVHAITRSFEHLGVPISDDNTETFAYTLGALFSYFEPYIKQPKAKKR